jgi:hypothetical protein
LFFCRQRIPHTLEPTENVLEIAGNRRILATVLGRTDAALATLGATELFAIPIQSRPGWRRLGLDVEVEKLTALIGEVERQGGEFEHAYPDFADS